MLKKAITKIDIPNPNNLQKQLSSSYPTNLYIYPPHHISLQILKLRLPKIQYCPNCRRIEIFKKSKNQNWNSKERTNPIATKDLYLGN